MIEIRGHHFYNRSRGTAGVVHVRDTLIKNLEEGTISLPTEFGTGPANPTKFETFTMKELGIGYVILAESEEIDPYFEIINDDYVDPSSADVLTGPGRDKKTDIQSLEPAVFKVPKYSFTIQFAWKEKLLRARLQERRQKELEAQRAAEEAKLQGNATPPVAPASN